MSQARSDLTERPLIWPIGGLDEDLSRTEQRAATSPELVNVRGTEPSTGRLRGGTREGTTRQAGPVNSTNPVRQIQIAQFDKRGSTFSQLAQGAHVENWAKTTPLIQACAANDIDLQRNRYVLDGRAGVAKYSLSGVLIWKLVLPVDSSEHICRALVVADDGTIYVAVSAGSPQKTAKLMKFRPDDTGQGVPNLEWTVVLAGYVERLRLRQGVLYAACNFPDRGASEIRAYRLIDTAVPDLAWKREQVPYPINDMDIRATDGAILTCHESNSTRSYNPLSPDTQKIAIDWTPDRITNYETIKWCKLDASDIDGSADANLDFKTGDLVETWFDLTGNGRNAYRIANIYGSDPLNCTPPTLNKSKHFAGQDTVQFANPTVGIGNAHNALATPANASTAPTVGDSQRTLIPTYDDAFWTLFIVKRVSDFTNARVPFGQQYAGGSVRACVINANTTGGSGITTSAGNACLHQTLASSGTAGPYAAYDNSTGFVVEAYTCKSSGVATPTDLCSVNGLDCTNETYTGGDFAGVTGSQLGRFTTTMTGATNVITSGATGNPFDGEIAYFECVKDILSTTDFEKWEGYLHWRFGIAHKLPVGHTYKLQPPTVDVLPGTTDSPYLQLTDTEQMLVKWDPNKARTRWVVKDDSSSTGTGGIGYGCAWPNNGAVDFCFSLGPKGAGTGGTATQIRTHDSVVRRIKDNGDSASLTGSGTWESKWGAGLEPSYHYPKCCVSGVAANSDQDGSAASDFFVPYHESTSGTQDAVYVYLTSGTAAGSNNNTPPNRTIALASGSRGYCVTVERNEPEYTPGTLDSLIDQFVFVGTEIQGASTNTLSDVKLVTEARANVTPRGTYVAAVAGTAIRRITAGVATPVSAPTLAGLNYTSIVAAFQRLWIVDGSGAYVLDPRLSDGIAKTWRSKTSGDLPRGTRGLSYWRGRMMLWRGVEDPTVVFGTAIDNPYDCDLSPVVRSGAEAVTIPIGSPVNAFIPFDNDTAIVGTQTSIHIQTGDSAQAGNLDLVGDIQGIAFGEAWCKDPEGRVYAFGSRGGVAMVGPRGVESISEKRIRRRLEDIDLGTYFIRLVWNWRAGGLHVFLIPQGVGTGQSFGYFWERRTNAWYRDEFPWWIYSARQVDGDGIAERAVWIGNGEGNVCRFDETADNDDGHDLHWSVVGGPIRSASRRAQVIVSRPRFVFADALEGAKVALLASGSSELPAIESAEWALTPPLTDAAPIRARGGNVWWRLRGKGRMGFEEGSCMVEEFGVRQAIA